jgi:hypothetical protein
MASFNDNLFIHGMKPKLLMTFSLSIFIHKCGSGNQLMVVQQLYMKLHFNKFVIFFLQIATIVDVTNHHHITVSELA